MSGPCFLFLPLWTFHGCHCILMWSLFQSMVSIHLLLFWRISSLFSNTIFQWWFCLYWGNSQNHRSLWCTNVSNIVAFVNWVAGIYTDTSNITIYQENEDDISLKSQIKTCLLQFNYACDLIKKFNKCKLLLHLVFI